MINVLAWLVVFLCVFAFIDTVLSYFGIKLFKGLEIEEDEEEKTEAELVVDEAILLVENFDEVNNIDVEYYEEGDEYHLHVFTEGEVSKQVFNELSDNFEIMSDYLMDNYEIKCTEIHFEEV